MSEFKELVGKTIIEITGANKGSGEITFKTDDNKIYVMNHSQDCCEVVEVEDITGDINDIINSPILVAEEVTSQEEQEFQKDNCDDSFTWTFYKLRTIKGSVDIRWFGESNGYYSEKVDFYSYEAKP